MLSNKFSLSITFIGTLFFQLSIGMHSQQPEKVFYKPSSQQLAEERKRHAQEKAIIEQKAEEFVNIAYQGNPLEVLDHLKRGFTANEPAKSVQNDSLSPLTAALIGESSSENRYQIASLLLGCGADINAQSEYGETTLSEVIVNGGSYADISFLAEHGANLRQKNSLGLTPRQYARMVGNKEAEKALRYYLTPYKFKTDDSTAIKPWLAAQDAPPAKRMRPASPRTDGNLGSSSSSTNSESSAPEEVRKKFELYKSGQSIAPKQGPSTNSALLKNLRRI